jgi:hypothetical protein
MKSPLISALLAFALMLPLTACGPTGQGTFPQGPTGPNIDTEPANASVAVGAAATFSVMASGTAPLTYQWARGTSAISGATSSSFTTAAATLADNGAIFTVTVTNAQGSVTSSPATLIVGGAGAGTLPKGQYSFSYTGQNSAGPISIVGSFSVDGHGDISAGIEDIASVKTSNGTVGVQPAVTMTGTYTVGVDGRGTMVLNTSSNGTQNFAFVISAENHAQFTWFDATATGSGSFDLQDPAVLAAAAPSGTFVFGLNGLDSSANLYSRVGVFTAASGSIANGGESDLNNALGAGGVSLAQTITAGTIGAPDHTTGRGTFSLSYGGSAVNYIYYVVSVGKLNLVAADNTASVFGTATLQAGGPFSTASLNGNYVFSIIGANGTAAFSDAGQFVADGLGTLTGVGDQNLGSVPTSAFALAGSFAMVTANGRGTMELALPAVAPASAEFVFYIASSNITYLMESDNTGVSSGLALAQTGGPYTTASLLGTYGVQIAGLQAPMEVSASGQLVAGGTGTASGTLDVNDVSSITPPFASTIDSGSMYTVTDGAKGRVTVQVNGVFPVELVLYFVSPTQFILFDTEDVTIGSGQTQ